MDAVTGRLTRLHMIPTQTRRFRVQRATREDTTWLMDMLNREGKKLGTRVALNDDQSLDLSW